MNISKADTVGAVVAKDYRTATVFDEYSIDFCCNGHRSIEEACKKAGVNDVELLNRIREKIDEQPDRGVTDYNSWPLDLLTDYIEKKHHRYVNEQIPVIQKRLQRVCTVHGAAHPELYEIQSLFNSSAGELTTHMKKEELMVFPFIRKMITATQTGSALPVSPFGTVQNPIRVMLQEHEDEGDRFRRIAEISDDYTPPADGCGTYRLTLALLKAFEEDLHLHIHLENNILFPKAIELEQAFSN